MNVLVVNCDHNSRAVIADLLFTVTTMAASASGTDVCVYCMTACNVDQLKCFYMKGISPLVALKER